MDMTRADEHFNPWMKVRDGLANRLVNTIGSKKKYTHPYADLI